MNVKWALVGLVTACASGTSAFAGDIFESTLHRVSLDPRLVQDAAQAPESGKVTIDLTTSEVTLSLDSPGSCRGTALCLARSQSAIGLRLPIVSVDLDECGAKRILASNEVQSLLVIDNTVATCPRITILPPTSVSLKSRESAENGDAIELNSTFDGERIKSVESAGWNIDPLAD